MSASDPEPEGNERGTSPQRVHPAAAPEQSTASHATPQGTDGRSDVETVDVTQDYVPSTLEPGLAGASPQRSRSPAALPQHRVFGDYELIEELARGGMGVVYKARQVKLHRVVALKMILAGQLASQHDVERFYTEAEAAARLDHPGIVPIYEVDEFEGQHFYSMGFVDGESLADRATRHPFKPREAAELMVQVCEAVQYAHDHGIVHRDLKPRNILLTAAGAPRITDFGLAAKMEAGHELTASGQILGTPSYMPPEQAAGRIKEIGPPSDVYALGAVLYFLLTGRPPFQTGSTVETIRQVLESDPLAPRLLNPSVHRDLETICLKCLEKEAARRYPSASELGAELRRFLADEPILARRIGPLGRAWRWARRKPLVAALAAAVLVIVATAGISAVAFRYARETRQLTRINRALDDALAQAQLTGGFLQRADALVDELGQLAPDQVARARQRVNEAFAGQIQERLRAAKLEPEDLSPLEAALTLFETRDAAGTRALRAEFVQRQTRWEPIFHLRPPYAERDDVFPRDGPSAAAAGDYLVIPPTNQPGARRLLTKVATPAAARLAATLRDGWEAASRLAVVCNATPQQSYEFALLVPTTAPAADAESPKLPAATDFAGVRRQDGQFIIGIFRNGLPLLQHSIHHALVPSGSLTIRGTRERGQLAIQINTLPPLGFRDPFPLSAAQPGVFAVDLPAGIQLAELHAQRKLQPPQASPLEHGDELFDAGRYEEALAFYQQQVRETADVQFAQESRYKQASCLIELNRLDDAALLLAPLMSEPQEIWPPLAACQLWMVRLLQKNRAEADSVYETLASRFRFDQLAALVPDGLRQTILEAYRSDLSSVAGMFRYEPQRVQKMERLAAIDRLFSADGRGDDLTQIEVARAYRFLGDQHAALRIVEPVAKGSSKSTTWRHYLRLLRMTGQPRAALEQLDQTAQNPVLRDDVNLLVERARVYAALEDWQACEATVDEVYWRLGSLAVDEMGTLVYAGLMKGFLLERRDAAAGAQGVWRQAFRICQPELGRSSEAKADVLHTLIMGSLTGELSATDTQAFYSRTVVGSGDSSIVRLGQSLVDPQTIETCVQRMWRSEIGRRYAEAYAYESLTMRERIRTPAVLGILEYFREAGIRGDLSADQETILFEIMSQLFDALLVEGKITVAQMAQLALSWKGTTNFLGWEGVAPTLEPQIRAGMAYLFGHRFLRLNDQAQAAKMWETSVRDAEPSSAVARLARRDLELLKAGQGWLVIDADAPEPVPIAIRRGDAVSQTTTVNKNAEIHLAAGDYTLAVAERAEEYRLSRRQVNLAAGGGARVKLTWLWKPATVDDSLPGLLPQPAPAAAGGRWQLYYRDPRLPATTATWSPDGRRIALGAQDGLVRLLAPGTLETVKLLPGRAGAAATAVWSPDATRLAVLDGGRDVRVYSVEAGQTPLRLAKHSGAVLCGQWSPAADLFVSGCQDRTMRWWPSGQPSTSTAAAYEVKAMAFSPDGQLLASAGWIGDGGHVVDIWDTAKGTIVQQLPVGPSPCELLAWSPDGSHLAAATSGDAVEVFRRSTGPTRPDPPGEDRPAGRDALHASGAAEPTAARESVVWSRTRTLQGGHGAVRSLVWQADGTRLAGFFANSGAVEWDLGREDKQPIRAVRVDDVWAAAFSPDLKRLAVSSGGGTISLLDAASGKALATRGRRGGVTALDVSADGSRVLMGAGDGGVRILDAEGRVISARPPEPRPILAARFSPGGDRFAYALADGNLRVCDREGAELAAARCGGEPRALAFQAAGDRLLVACGLPNLQRFNPQDGSLTATLAGVPRPIVSVDSSAQGRIVTGDDQGRIGIWENDQPLRTLSLRNGGPVAQTRISPDGRWLAAIDSGRCVSLVSLDNPSEPLYLEAGDDAAWLSWNSDSTNVAVGSFGGVLRVWTTVGKKIAEARLRRMLVNTACWLPGKSTLWLGLEDSTVQVWDLSGQRFERTILPLAGGPTAVLTSSGRILAAPPSFQNDVVYGLETSDGSLELLRPQDFHQRHHLPWPPP